MTDSDPKDTRGSEALSHDGDAVGDVTWPMGPSQVAEAFRSGRCLDRAFDCFLPPELRLVSHQYWTPLAVAKRTGEWLADLKVRTVVDIGSGAGKWCVAAALTCDCQFTGLERRSRLVATARTLAQMFEVDHRVNFVEGTFGDITPPIADAYYLFNPFGEYLFDSREQLDSYRDRDQRRVREVAAVRNLLHRAPKGTCVVTYNGFGGRVPATYQRIRADDELPNPLRLWRKTRAS